MDRHQTKIKDKQSTKSWLALIYFLVPRVTENSVDGMSRLAKLRVLQMVECGEICKF